MNAENLVKVLTKPRSAMASNMNNNVISEIEIVNSVNTLSTNVSIEEKSSYHTQEEQDNIKNMNANNQHSSPSCTSTHTETIDNANTETIDNATVNNNHVEEVTNVPNSKKNPNTGNNMNNGQCHNGNNTTELINVPEEIEHVSAVQDCDNTEDISMSNALSDLMNTYSSDEDMFENFRSKQEFDDPKSEDECLSSSTSFLSIHESGNSSEEEPIACAPKKSNGVKLKSTRNKGELDLDDLPPIEDLQISVPEDQCLPVGKILNIVDTLVLIKTLKNTPTLDLDSVLFLEKGARTLGKIFDVIGPVCGPVYCVRFNSHQHIVDSNIHIDQDVYCAPQTEHTSYVPLPSLINSKGSDASWEKDKEPPPEVVEFSDDEEERRVKRNTLRTRNNRNNQQSTAGDDTDGPSDPKSQRPTPFEQRMNLRNLLMTASYERRTRLLNDTATTGSTSRPQAKPYASGNIIRAPTLPDIPPLPIAQPVATPRFTSPQVDMSGNLSHTVPHPQHQPPRYGTECNSPRLPTHSLGVFTPPPLFHQNKKRPSTASPFTPHAPRFSSPFSPPAPMFSAPPFTSLPPPPLFNDPMLLFTQAPPLYPPMSPMYTPAPPPFQFGMPPLLGHPRTGPPPPRYRHSPPRPPNMIRPAFGSRHRF